MELSRAEKKVLARKLWFSSDAAATTIYTQAQKLFCEFSASAESSTVLTGSSANGASVSYASRSGYDKFEFAAAKLYAQILEWLEAAELAVRPPDEELSEFNRRVFDYINHKIAASATTTYGVDFSRGRNL